MILHPLHVLVVDDDEVDRMAARRALKGHHLIDASNVKDAVALLDKHRIDVAIVDYFLPPDTGADAITRLRARVPGLPIIVLSGQGNEEVVAEVLRAGADDYLAKSAVSEPRRLSMLTERTVAAAELRKQNERNVARLAVALDAAGAGAWQVDTERNVSGGPRFRELFALPDELESLPWGVWRGQFVPADAERFDKALAEDQVRFQGKLVTGRWVELRGRRERDGALFGAVLDVTDNREAEARNLALKDRLMGIASHDLKNPLSAVRMGARLLAQSERLTDQERKIVGAISTSTERMTRLVSQLLDLTRVRAGTALPLELQDIDLESLVKTLVEEASLSTGRSFATSLDKVMVRADPDRLGQVVSNLLGNAVTHGDSLHSIQVRVREISGGARIEVENHGQPIAPEVRETLFEPFVQARTATRDGLGLGLFISREVMRAHGGTLDVKSTEDGKICFIAELRNAQKSDAAQ
ncbi:MAG: response regulator [Archangium sp.]